ncbi:DUF4013 domain-containing protein [Halalkalicoccus jeotgali]|uniref:DUF4013 domain-containing protein n=1 Tax=Halalkalicoccus jeotgali (strain DSM 18796 / CECT 7217 / JCM 14584 / KCTC 4019 / B3) TaxID=795797 RepID=D8J397_HALJB|nr:DUF4013 domain-containing protein [Halalkalicoccus jeotgali]ADJ15204.1 hypothetical protein HacjB3_09105 [Halalkalicoccus jeotgali B3]ELY35219.1 hypothetical protein C497_13573 [Halalkalicoccus jeotgali B3]
MLGDAIEYPARGEDALTTVLVGGLLPVLSAMVGFVGLALSVVLIGLAILPFAALPLLALCGYYVAVLRRVAAGDPDPPQFRNWGRLIVDGLRFLAVSIAYAIPFALLLGLFFAVLAASEAAVGSSAAETVAAIGAVLTALLAVGSLVAYAYLQPLALANLAREGRLGAAFDLGTIRKAGLSRAYATAWALGALVWAVGAALEGALWVVTIGLFVGFYADVARYYLYGRGLGRALSGPPAREPPRAEDRELPPPVVPASERAACPVDPETIPRIEDPATFETRTGGRDRRRGWPDWESESDPDERP